MAAARLVGVSEIAEMLDVSRQRASQLCAYKGFPDQVELVAPIDEMTEAIVRAMFGQIQDGKVTADDALAALESGGHRLGRSVKLWRLDDVIRWADREGRTLQIETTGHEQTISRSCAGVRFAHDEFYLAYPRRQFGRRVGAAFAAGRASGGEIRASISGHYSASATSVAQNGSSETQTSSISWSATVSGSENDILQGKALPKLTSLTGMVSASGGAGGGAACSGTLSAATQGLAQSDYQSLLVVYPPGYPAITAPGVGPQSNTTKQYLVEASLPQKFVVSSAGNDANSGCSTMLAQSFLNAGPLQGDPQYTAWQKTRHPWAYFDADGNSPAPTVTGNVSGTATGGGSYQSQAQETFTFGGGTGGTSISSGSCSHPPTITANPSDVKANGHTTVAGCGFKHHSKVALVECLETSWIAPHKPCDTDNGVTVTTNASGGFRTAMKVDACRGVAPAGITEDCYIGVTKSTGVDTIALQPVVTIALNSP